MKINKLLLIGLSVVLSQISVAYAYTDIAPALDEEKMKAVKEQQGIGVNKPEFDVDAHAKKYKKVTKDGAVMQALELMDTNKQSREGGIQGRYYVRGQWVDKTTEEIARTPLIYTHPTTIPDNGYGYPDMLELIPKDTIIPQYVS